MWPNQSPGPMNEKTDSRPSGEVDEMRTPPETMP